MIARLLGWLRRTRYDPATDPDVIALHAHRDEALREVERLRREWHPTGHFLEDYLTGNSGRTAEGDEP